MPKVSVILPNYNHARFLHRRIAGILSQTYQDFELIILDDFSTDGSKEIIESYRTNPKVSHIIYNSSNSGSPFVQWNRGIAVARGAYVWIAESDDDCDKEFLDRLVGLLEKQPQIGLAYSQSLEIDEVTGQTKLCFSDHVHFSEDFRSSFQVSGKYELERRLKFENTIPNASAVVFRRALYLEAGGADESMRLCGDWNMWTKLLLRSDVAFVSEPLNRFRLTPTSARSINSWIGTAHERLTNLVFMENNGIDTRAIQIQYMRRVWNSFGLLGIRPVWRVLKRVRDDQKKRFSRMALSWLLSIKYRVSAVLAHG